MAVRLLAKRLVITSCFRPPIHRLLSSDASMKCSMHVEFTQLRSRGLLKVEGQDAVKFLHGLVTNDVELFHSDKSWNAMYAMFLNSSGRILQDVIFYKSKNAHKEPSFLIECDANAASDVVKHLKMHKLRAKVDVCGAPDLIPWAIFSSKNPFDLKSTGKDVYASVKDPRLRELGFRILLPRDCLLSSYFEDLHESDETAYKVHRTKLGVCEGVQEMRPGSALPLEFNLTYLNGGRGCTADELLRVIMSFLVSFHKGCYLGQELTARTYHTGVIRKRVMPFTVEGSVENVDFQEGSSIVTPSGKKAGKLCAIQEQYGMGVLRLEMVKNADKVFLEDASGNSVEISVKMPHWWPKEDH